MATPRVRLNPSETAALTRLVLSYCLGRGSICLCSRSYSLQLHQPKAHMDYIHYQWRRLRQFLPETREPRYHPVAGGDDTSRAGQWRLRVSSKYFETAFQLLYPIDQGAPVQTGETPIRHFQVSSAVLELLGAEAIASLWADRGRILTTRGANYATGRLNLSRFSFEQAELIGNWIRTLTGCEATLDHGPRSFEAPMLYYDWAATEHLIKALTGTWMSQADCLQRKFTVPSGFQRSGRASLREKLQAEMLMPATLSRRAPGSLLQKRRDGGGRRVPGAASEPRPEHPPAIKQQAVA
jgi:hypothetical protein